MAAKRCEMHGLAALKVRSWKQIDRRSSGFKAIMAWKAELLRDLGGDVSAQRLALVDLALRTRLYLEHVDCWLVQQESLLNRRRKTLIPALRERQQLVDSLARLLGQLGLERVAQRVPALSEYLREKEAAK